MSLEEQFRYLQPITEEDFRQRDAALRMRNERDIEMGWRSRETVEKEWAHAAQNQALIVSLRRAEMKSDHELENYVDEAICRNCGGLVIDMVWTERMNEERFCECPSSSDDEAALPSPPQTPSRTADVFDGIVNVSRRQWLKERLLMDMRGPYRFEFEDYNCWREAKVRFSQISTEPAMDMTQPAIDTIHLGRSTKTHIDRGESIRRRICGLLRWAF